MKSIVSIVVVTLLLLTACHHLPRNPPGRLVYSSGFSFANYDYFVIAKPDSQNTSTSLYGMDIEFANLMSRYNMNIIGDKEYLNLSQENKKRTLFARMALIANGRMNLISVSFDDAISGRTGASISASAKGDIFNSNYRTRVFEALSRTVVKALQTDKGISVRDEPTEPATNKMPKTN